MGTSCLKHRDNLSQFSRINRFFLLSNQRFTTNGIWNETCILSSAPVVVTLKRQLTVRERERMKNQSQIAVWGIVLTLGALLFSAEASFAGSPKLARDLEGKNPASQVDVIVQFRETPTQMHFSKVQTRGGLLRRQLGLVKAGAFRMPVSALKDLANDPDVTYISPDRPLYGTSNGSPTAVLDYHTDTANAPVAWGQGLNGSGIGVAVIDSGIIDIPDFHAQNNVVVFSQKFCGRNLR